MKGMKAIHSRYSVRRFKSDPVDTELIKEILKAGMAAPSAGSQYPAEYWVLTRDEDKKAISEASPYAKPAEKSAGIIVVCANINRINKKEIYQDLWIQDLAAATENMLITITYYGLGGVWLCIYPFEERIKKIKEILNCGDDIIPFATIALGYADGEVKKNDRTDFNRVHWKK
jgi:nitroreductase